MLQFLLGESTVIEVFGLDVIWWAHQWFGGMPHSISVYIYTNLSQPPPRNFLLLYLFLGNLIIWLFALNLDCTTNTYNLFLFFPIFNYMQVATTTTTYTLIFIVIVLLIYSMKKATKLRKKSCNSKLLSFSKNWKLLDRSSNVTLIQLSSLGESLMSASNFFYL